MTGTGTRVAGRLDHLPILPFHRRLLWLIGAGMFFESFDIDLAGSVLAGVTVALLALAALAWGYRRETNGRGLEAIAQDRPEPGLQRTPQLRLSE